MIRWLLCLGMLAPSAGAETARVISGEHADFTRLVIELPAASDWTVGRTAMGYGFATLDDRQPDYDLSRVWQRIPRTRLQALRTDPDTGALLLTLACPCHVFPFEYQPGMVVLDIRSGAPPPGSAFEADLDLPGSGRRGSPPTTVAGPETYDWLALDRDRAVPEESSFPRRPATARSAETDPLRDALLLQISRGAADGIVDMRLPGKPRRPETGDIEDPDQARISIGELPGIEVVDGRADPDMRPTEGLACLPDEQLAVVDWGAGKEPHDVLVAARSNLFGEFDTPDSDALMAAVRLHLYLGFGAEALQYAGMIPEPVPSELVFLRSMARLVDGMSDPSGPFKGMLGCEGTAALWAALAHDELPGAEAVNAEAIVRGFQALPPQLRRHLGARLTDLLREGEPEAARMIRDAMERTPEVRKGEVALLDAMANLQADRPDAALTDAMVAVADGAVGPRELLALVEAHFRSGEPMAADVAEALRAYQREARNTADEGPVRRALVLALALSGQISEAFAAANPSGGEMPDLWRVIAEQGSDNALLTHAVVKDGSAIPDVAPDVAFALATRLQDLGFPRAALDWLGPVSVADGSERRLLAAEAELARGDARQALTLVSGLAGPDAGQVRAEAEIRLGALAAAQSTLADVGLAEEAARLAAWKADWSVLQSGDSAPWAAAADYATASPVPEGGPLARGLAAIEGSEATREAISGLLAAVPVPSP